MLVKIPAFSGQTKEVQQRYTRTVLDALPEDGTLKGAIIDLRGNTGGNMYPMIAAVHRFLPDDDILRFKSRRFTTPISRSLILRSVGIDHFFELGEGEHDSSFYLPYVIDSFKYMLDRMPE